MVGDGLPVLSTAKVMKIAMFTNTYLPHVGGVAKSVKALEDGCRVHGHEVRVIAPEFDGEEGPAEVLRVPSIRNFNDSGFCVKLPSLGLVRDFMDAFQPDIIHSHHPFLLGDTALREAWKTGVPIVFTHHTLYERYTHYVPFDSTALKRAAIQLATEYCNLCDLVIAPSESIARLLRERQVRTNVEVVPTGIDTGSFARGRNFRFRNRLGIPWTAKVVGHVGRLAKEKNLEFLGEAVARCLEVASDAVFLLVGDGECSEDLLELLKRHVDGGRIYHPGKQTGDDLIDAYAAIDCFAFSSQSETQGMVLAEAMAAGSPVVALDGPGVREIIKDGENGILLHSDASPGEFAEALLWILGDEDFSRSCSPKAIETAAEFDTEPCVMRVLGLYQALISSHAASAGDRATRWDRFVNGIEIEWDLVAARMSAAAAAVMETPTTEASLD
jgi:glycosyltransferase involved in cell wall biosynthesis